MTASRRPPGSRILDGVPELPEVEALAAFLRERAVGHAVARLDTPAISALKTFDPPPSAIAGLEITGAGRYGKFLDLDPFGVRHPLYDHLSNTLPAANHDRRAAEIDRDHLNFAAIIRIDRAWTIDHRQTVL